MCVFLSLSLSSPVCIFVDFVTLERILSTLCGFSRSDRRKILLDMVSEKVVTCVENIFVLF